MAFEYAPHVGRPRMDVPPTRASQSIEPGCAGTPRRTTRPPSASIAGEERVSRIRARGAGGEDQVGRVGAAGEPGDGRLDGVGVVLDVDDVEDLRAQPLDLGADALLEPGPRRPPDRSP